MHDMFTRPKIGKSRFSLPFLDLRYRRSNVCTKIFGFDILQKRDLTWDYRFTEFFSPTYYMGETLIDFENTRVCLISTSFCF